MESICKILRIVRLLLNVTILISPIPSHCTSKLLEDNIANSRCMPNLPLMGLKTLIILLVEDNIGIKYLLFISNKNML